jgi:hydrophobe/amphiphile efflux-1 (HAE1) family protein
MNFSAFSIRNPVPALLLFVILTFIGIMGFRSLGIQNFPDMELPLITVSATLEGAAPEQLETEVARKLEDKLATITGLDHLATTISDGSVQIRASFKLEKNGNDAQTEVRNAVDSVRNDLPGELTNPVVAKLSTAGAPILTYTVAAQSMDEEALSWLIDNELSKALLAVKGVGQVSRLGGVNREVQVDLHAGRMAGLGVSVADVSNRLKAAQQNASGGRGDLGGAVQSVRTLGAVESVPALAALEIPLSEGRHVRLDQVAQVRDGIAQRSSIVLLDGKPAQAIQITRSKGESEVTVAKAVRSAMQQFQRSHPQLRLQEAYNSVTPVEENYRGSMHLLLEGALLAILVVWWFLRDWRATLVSAAALPLSVIPTFAVMQAFGFSLNMLTLLALALVVGILVDDAIVEIENIVRHLRMGKPPLQAAREAADEIGLAVIATTFTLIAVFLPTAFMGGIPGQFFKQFGITAAAAVFFSLVVARLLTPMMAAYLLKPQAQQESESALMRRYLGWVQACLNHPARTMLAVALFFVGSLSLIPLLPTTFIPAPDHSQIQVTLEMQPGTALSEMERVAQQAQVLIRQEPEVRQVFAAVGVGSSAGALHSRGALTADASKSTLTVSLSERGDRARSQQAVEAALRQRLAALPATRVSMGAGEVGEKLEITLVGDNAARLNQAAGSLVREMRSLPNLGNITLGSSLQQPEIQLRPDPVRAAELGVSTQAMANVVRLATAGDFAHGLSKLNLPERQIPIRVRLQAEVRHDLDALSQLRVAARNGTVPLSSVAQIEMGSGPSRLERLDRRRSVKISVELNGRALGQVMKEISALPTMNNLPAGVQRQPSGEAERMAELFASFGVAMAIGILAIYVVLVLLFHDFLQPITILAALPLSLGGALLALLLANSSLSMPAVIGLLMLMGVVTKNSILLVEYAVMARREHGLSRTEALLDASRKRARPILMTTIAMASGMLPIALGWGADPSFRQPMALVVIGGLLTSTVLSLLVIPVMFALVDDLLLWLRRGRGQSNSLAEVPGLFA